MSTRTGTNHQLHKTIGSLMRAGVTQAEVLLDADCEVDPLKPLRRLPLFRTDSPGRDVQYCNVDILVLQNYRIKAIVEIEESGVKPSKICGKIMTSALSGYFIHESQSDVAVSMADKVLFIQVLNLPAQGITKSRHSQWNNLKTDIRRQLPIGVVSHYELLLGSVDDFKGEMGEKLIDLVGNFLCGRDSLGSQSG